MTKYLNLIHIVVSILLIACILLQARGSGLSSLFGGSGGEFYQKRRGIEKIIFIATIILAIIFLGIGVIRLVV